MFFKMIAERTLDKVECNENSVLRRLRIDKTWKGKTADYKQAKKSTWVILERMARLDSVVSLVVLWST